MLDEIHGQIALNVYESRWLACFMAYAAAGYTCGVAMLLVGFISRPDEGQDERALAFVGTVLFWPLVAVAAPYLWIRRRFNRMRDAELAEIIRRRW